MDFGQGRSLREIGRELEDAWQRGLDKAASKPLAHAACMAVHGEIDPVRDYDGIVAAAEFLWDAEEDLILVKELLKTWRRRVHQLTSEWNAADAFEPRFRASLLQARLAFRAEEYETAQLWSSAAVRSLQRAVGGNAALRQIVAGYKPTRVGELYGAYLAIQLPVTRMNHIGWPAMRQLHDLNIRDALSIIRHLPAYDRLPALVTQTFFAVAVRDDPGDSEIVDRLALYDRELRPDTKRAQCTRLLVEMTLAGYHGDLEAERLATIAAEQALLKAGLHRHIRSLNNRRWWGLRPAA